MAALDHSAEIILQYSSIFTDADAHDWTACRACFTDELEVDYSSLNSQPAARVKADDLIAAWKGFLPKFKFTLHFLTNHRVTIGGDKATASCYGHAIHNLPDAPGGDLWGVYGTYDIELVRTKKGWLVSKLKYNHKYQDGNSRLPELASRG